MPPTPPPSTPARRSIGLVLDCADADRIARFWTAALGYRVVSGDRNYRRLRPAAGYGPSLLLQEVPDERTGKNRMHIDIDVEDVEREVRRLEQLGASRLAAFDERGIRWVVMTDPEGNEFCVCPLGPHVDDAGLER